jgi:hypothetical protein
MVEFGLLVVLCLNLSPEHTQRRISLAILAQLWVLLAFANRLMSPSVTCADSEQIW